MDHELFLELKNQLQGALNCTAPLDAVLAYLHGAAVTTAIDDPEGALLAQLRQQLGPSVPLVVICDLHGHVSDAMLEHADWLLAHLENPHTDDEARGREAARGLARLLMGERPVQVHRRLPLIAAQLCQRTVATEPLGEVRALATARATDQLWHAALLPGYAYTDCVQQGMTVIVSGTDGATCTALADELAAALWARRNRFQARLPSIDDAIAELTQSGIKAQGTPRILVDTGDNPGGGATARETTLLNALAAAGMPALHACFHEPDWVAAAQRAGIGQRMSASALSGHSGEPATAEVLALSDGRYRPTQGVNAGRDQNLGPCALLRVGTQRLLVTSVRDQPYDPELFRALFQLDPFREPLLVFKARGHFRAAFQPPVADADIIEIATAGLTDQALTRFPYQRVRRPIFPLDRFARWPNDHSNG